MLEYGDSKGLWAGWEDVREMVGRRVEECTGVQMSTQKPTTEARRHGEQDGAYRGFARMNADKRQSQSGSPLESYFSSGPLRRDAASRRKLEAAAASRTSLRSELRREASSRGQAPQFPTPELLDESLLYGEPFSLEPMATAPTNEAGVMFLFATLARELGYVVIKVQKAFPDCEAFRRLGNGRWQRVRIEFEFNSRNFVLHGHDVKGCELLVCWENDWQECPLEVIELKRIFTADLRGSELLYH
jgi:hypothetical protein